MIAALRSASIDTLHLLTESPSNLTHLLALSFEPNSAWKLGDPPLSRFKLIAGAVQPESHTLQYLRWCSYADPEAMIRWMRSEQEGRPPAPAGSTWEAVPRIMLFKTSQDPDAEWEIQTVPQQFFSTYEGGRVFKSFESTEGWLERLAAALAGGGGRETERVSHFGTVTKHNFCIP